MLKIALILSLLSTPALALDLATFEAQNQGIKSWSADFVQKTFVELVGQELEKSGQIQAKKPGAFFINYPDKTYRYNGKTLWLEQHASKSVLKFKNPGEWISKEALDFLSGLYKASGIFIEADKETAKQFFEEYDNPKLSHIALSPIHPDSQIVHLNLGINEGTGLIEEVYLWTKSGNKTHYVFKNIVKNPKLDTAAFSLKKKKGYKIITK